jgi:alpha 1,6-mannosyltransferase
MTKSWQHPAIPKTIWYKVGPKGLNENTKKWTNSCIGQNPEHRATFMTDQTSHSFVIERFGDRPDLLKVFTEMTIPIVKADLIRYLLLFSEGGMWADLDVSCEGVAIDDWVPLQYKEKAGLVVGWEFDVGWGPNFVRQLQTWTIMAKPGTVHLWKVIEDIILAVEEAAKSHNVPIDGLTLDMVGDIVDLTGPRRFTRSVLASLESQMKEEIEPSTIANLLEPKLVGDVLIMPGYAFAASANNYSEYTDKPLGPTFVQHHYAGSWKNKHGGE